MFSAVRMGPAVSAIDRVLISFAKSFVKRWEVLARQKYTDHNENRKNEVIGMYFRRAGTSQFLTCEIRTHS